MKTMIGIKTGLIFCMLIVFSTSNLYAQGGTLKDKDGQVMRATPMVIGKGLAASVAFAENKDNWTKIRDTYKLNTIRLCWVDPWYKMRGWDNWDVAEAMPHIEKCVQNATKTNMNIIINHHVTGENMEYTDKDNVQHPIDYNRNHALRVDFWRSCAQKFKNNDRVFFELSNEPVFYHNHYTNATFKKNLMEIYNMVRSEDPDRQIQMFSFNGTHYDLAGVINNYKDGIDWSKTSVAFHGYHDTSSEKIRDIMKTYRVICTEWDYPNTHDYVKPIDGEYMNSQTWERLKISWADWRGWMDNTTNEIEERLIPDAKTKGYWWGGNTDILDEGGVSPAGSENIKIFQNQSGNLLYYNLDKNINRVEVRTFTGRLLFSINNLNKKHSRINITQLAHGAYLISFYGALGHQSMIFSF